MAAPSSLFRLIPKSTWRYPDLCRERTCKGVHRGESGQARDFLNRDFPLLKKLDGSSDPLLPYMLVKRFVDALGEQTRQMAVRHI